MELQIVAKKENPLLSRVEVTFKSVHLFQPFLNLLDNIILIFYRQIRNEKTEPEPSHSLGFRKLFCIMAGIL